MHGLRRRPSQDPTRQPGPNQCRVRIFRDPLSIVLVVVIVGALGIAGILGCELYARHRATSMLEKVVECVAGDHASVSLGARPLLLQLMTGNFPDISIETAGNQFREAKGMKLHVQIADLRLPTARPLLTDSGLALQVLTVSGFGFTLPPESVQPPLDAFTSIMTKSLPAGVHADSVRLTESGMTARFSARHASIPVAQADPCFASL